MEFDVNELQKEYAKKLHKFSYNRAKYLEGLGYKVDDEARRQIRQDYQICISDVERYLDEKFPIGFVDREGLYSLDFEDMAESVPEDTRSFVRVPRIDCTVKPLGDKSKALLTFEDGVITEAHNMHTIEELPEFYHAEVFNKLLKGVEIDEIREFLADKGVLPARNILDTMMKEHIMRLMERKDFFETLITKLLMYNMKEETTRAYILDCCLGLNFDFDKFRVDEIKRTK